MPVYQDPRNSDYPHPRLLLDLLARPSRIDLLPLEVQVTIILAWLLDRSPAFSSRLLGLFFGDEQDFASTAIGARTAVSMPAVVPGRTLHPDLSIDVGERAAQLLVEVKIDAAFHTHTIEETAISQPDAYVYAWRRAICTDEGTEARQRRVGTLSRIPAQAPQAVAAPADEQTFRGADLSWHAVRDLVCEVDASTGFGPCEVIARDFVAVIDRRIIHSAKMEIEDPTLAWAYDLLADVLPALVGHLPGASLGNKVAPQADYVGRYLHLDFGLEEPIQLWIYVSAVGGRYNGGRLEANVWLSERPDRRASPSVRTQLQAGGFSLVTDAAGAALRRSLAVARLRACADLRLERQEVLDWLLRSLRQTGVQVI